MEKRHSAAAEHALSFLLLLSLASLSLSATDPNDLAILNQLRKNLENPELLKWPENGDDPCGAKWAYVFCAGSRVSQIHVQNLGLKGPLPQNFNQLTELTNIGLQRNHFSGPLPSLKGLSKLRSAFLYFNDFTSIPVDFFEGLDSLEVFNLDDNNLNASTGWNFPPQLGNSAQLQNLSCMSCNLVGLLPDYLGNMLSLTVLRLSGNGLSGEIPPSFNGLNLQILRLNNQTGGGLSGPIGVLTTMVQLNSVWLHGNQFSGVIPDSIGNLTSLKDLNLKQNQFVGLVPDGLANLALDSLDLNNNHLMGPIPKFKARNASFDSNAFCQSTPEVPCAAEVMALIEFLDGLNYPSTLVSKWSGNDPCGSWLGVSCGNNGKVSVINLPNYNLNGTLSPSVAMLESLVQIRLQNNNLQGLVPETWTSVKSLTELDLSGNNVSPPLPKFSSTVKVAVDGNRLFNGNPSAAGAAPEDSSSSSTDSGSHVKDRNVKKLPILISSAVLLLGMLIVGSILYIVKKKLRNEGVRKKDLRKEYLGEEREDMELPLFDFTTVAKATDHFSSGNKLGEGGFGSVYKGTLMGGKEVAVKRLSKNSGQGMREFKNEVMLIAKLQHRNLVKLLGCCTQEDEKILIYEFMPNRSLDFFIFEQEGQKLLNWAKCFHIIGGIARGLLYLHHDSRLRIIHRDLKASNILLDANMNPKIADFGLAKIFDSDQSQANTNRVVGTYGYMSPEYAADGIVSMKSDVYSFGVILLEMLSRKKNRGFSHPDHHLNLLGHAWTLWMQDKQLELIDKTLSDSCNIYEVVRCLHVGLLCVQRVPEDRPSMPSVILMLSSDVALPAPKQPGFYTGRIIPESSSRMLPCSENTFSITLIEPR